MHPIFFHCKKLVACNTVLSKYLLQNFLYDRCGQNARKCISCCVITGQMFQNRWDHPWVIHLPTLPWLYYIAWLNTISSLLRELFTAMESPQLTRHITALLEEKGLFFLPHPLILSAFLSSQIIHSRAKSQSLSLSFSVCLYGSVNLPPPPLYYSRLLSSPLYPSRSWGGEKFMILVMFRGKAGNRVAQNSQSAYQCAWVMRLPQLGETEMQGEKAIESRREYDD